MKMKKLLETWLSEAPKALKTELSPELELAAAEQLPLAANAVSLAIAVSGARQGNFAVLIDRQELHALLLAAQVAEETSSTEWEAELWQSLVDQTAQATAKAIDGVQVAPAATAPWAAGLPAAAYQLRLGSAAMHVAFSDQTEAMIEIQHQPPVVEQAPAAPVEPARAGVELLLDVELEASLRFGSREMSLNEVLDLGPGDVVELDRHISEPVDLLVGDRIVARGEVVLVNGNFGFSVLEVAEAQKRLESIRCLF
jgi:flagellar motor switch protein FliN/FliY